jgi:hypothetical protein
VPDLERFIAEHPWAAEYHADAVVVITTDSAIVERWGLAQMVGEVLQALRLIKERIEQRLGGQESIVELLCREAVPATKPPGQPRKTRKVAKT